MGIFGSRAGARERREQRQQSLLKSQMEMFAANVDRFQEYLSSSYDEIRQEVFGPQTVPRSNSSSWSFMNGAIYTHAIHRLILGRFGTGVSTLMMSDSYFPENSVREYADFLKCDPDDLGKSICSAMIQLNISLAILEDKLLQQAVQTINTSVSRARSFHDFQMTRQRMGHYGLSDWEPIMAQFIGRLGTTAQKEVAQLCNLKIVSQISPEATARIVEIDRLKKGEADRYSQFLQRSLRYDGDDLGRNFRENYTPIIDLFRIASERRRLIAGGEWDSLEEISIFDWVPPPNYDNEFYQWEMQSKKLQGYRSSDLEKLWFSPMDLERGSDSTKRIVEISGSYKSLNRPQQHGFDVKIGRVSMSVGNYVFPISRLETPEIADLPDSITNEISRPDLVEFSCRVSVDQSSMLSDPDRPVVFYLWSTDKSAASRFFEVFLPYHIECKRNRAQYVWESQSNSPR